MQLFVQGFTVQLQSFSDRLSDCDDGILLPTPGRLAILSRPMSKNKQERERPDQEASANEEIQDQSSCVEDVQTLDEVLNKPPKEIGGPAGPEPTRYGDWERKGRCIDF